MVKKLISCVSLLVLMGPLASVSAEENGAGCGVGKMVMEGKSGKNPQIAASLINMAVNAVLPHQLSGMTSGTLGCDVDQTVSNEYLKDTFFAKNMDSLTIEIAQGDGDHLTSLASIMGIPDQDKAEFFSLLQENYSSIVASEDMIAGINSTLLVEPKFESYVQ